MCPNGHASRSSRIGRLSLHRTAVSKTHTVDVATTLNTETEPTSFTWIPDTGSDVDAVAIKQLTRLGGFIENLDDDHETVYSASGTALKNVGKIKASLTFGT